MQARTVSTPVLESAQEPQRELESAQELEQLAPNPFPMPFSLPMIMQARTTSTPVQESVQELELLAFKTLFAMPEPFFAIVMQARTMLTPMLESAQELELLAFNQFAVVPLALNQILLSTSDTPLSAYEH